LTSKSTDHLKDPLSRISFLLLPSNECGSCSAVGSMVFKVEWRVRATESCGWERMPIPPNRRGWFSPTLKSIPFIHRLPGLSSVMFGDVRRWSVMFDDVRRSSLVDQLHNVTHLVWTSSQCWHHCLKLPRADT